MQGLLDHQAVSVTLAGFRNEMSGLVRDIRAISKPVAMATLRRDRSRIGGIVHLHSSHQTFGFYNLLAHLHFPVSYVVSGSKTSNDIWEGKPGEWVMYGYATPVAGQPSASHQFKPSSVKIVGDRVTYEARYPVIAANATTAEKLQ